MNNVIAAETPELWTPRGVVQGLTLGTNIAAHRSRRQIVVHEFEFHDKQTNRSCIVKVPAEEGVEFNLIEDAAARSFERWLYTVRQEAPLVVPTAERRKEIGRAINEFRAYVQRRNESTNGKLLYLGLHRG